jgi:putative tricarboxylic transport membrane protein
MELIANIGLGFSTALTPANLLYCLAGVFLGTLIGVLPGLGPTATIAMLLPVTFTLPPVSALIMLALRHWTDIRWHYRAVPAWP